MRWPHWMTRARWDRERARELESDLEIETADTVARGMSPADARDAARRTLGNLTRIREEIHDMNGIGWLDRLTGDLRYAARPPRHKRGLPAVALAPLPSAAPPPRHNVGFAVVAIASLALGIGANTAIFQLLDAVRLRSLPVQAPPELVEVRLADMEAARGGI